MYPLILALCLFLALPTFALPATLQVGPTRTLTLPSQAAAVAQHGDLVEIDAGSYQDGAVWTASNLTLRGIGGLAHVHTATVHGKAIWLLQGNDTTVESIHFSGATVADGNGAGLRLEGKGLTLRQSRFTDNQNGLLTGGPLGIGTGSVVLVEHSEFARNGSGDGSTHNIYVSLVDSFTLQYSWSHGAKSGHLVKSRALVNTIRYNRLVDDPGGTASYEIDLPCGGMNTIIGNIIRQDAATDNSAILAHGNELHLATNCAPRPQALTVIYNTFVNARATAAWLQVKGTTATQVTNNLFAGPGASEVVLDPSNIQTHAPAFLDATQQRYQLTAASPGIDRAIDAGAALTPVWEYVHPLGKQPRVIRGIAQDVGAYEFGTPFLDVFPPPPPPPPPPVVAPVVTTLPLPAAPGWYALGNTAIRPVCATDPQVRGVSGCAAITSYSSGAMDTKRNRLIVWGGGHNAYYGNELYAINLTTLKAERLTEPGVPLALCTAYTAEGTQPASRHTYDGLAYMANVDRLFVYGGTIACEGGLVTHDVWTFDFATMRWEEMRPTGTLPPVTGVAGFLTSYDPNTGKVFVHDRQCLYTYDFPTNRFEHLAGSCQGVGNMVTSVLDPHRQELLITGGWGVLWVFDIRPGLPSYAPQQLATTGPQWAQGGYYPGLAYDPVARQVVGWVGGDTLLSLDRATNMWTYRAALGGPDATASAGIILKRFSYAPSLDAFVAMTDVDTNVHVLKRRGVTPPPPCDDTCPVCGVVNACGRTCPACPPPPPPLPMPQDVPALTVHRKYSDGTWRACEAQGPRMKEVLTWIQMLPPPTGLLVMLSGAPSSARSVQKVQRITGVWDAQTTFACSALGKSASKVLVLPPVPGK